MIPMLDVRRLSAEKKYADDLEFGFEPEDGLVTIPYVSLLSPAKAFLHYEIAEDNSVTISGKVVFMLKGLCSRCLKETSATIEAAAEGRFVPQNAKREDVDYSYSGFVVDLREFLRDAVLFGIPTGLYCSENCSAPEYK